ncbi:MAG: glycosyltransferase [Thermosipho sp. (in: Bacteria)]|nr:glycosyltransferase [Thermosipho sp. (in: thermotogales)]
MNILHYFLGFPPFHDGGLRIYATDLAQEQFKKGHKVKMIMPGIYVHPYFKSKIKFYRFQKRLPVYQIINSHPVSFFGVSSPSEFISEKRKNNYRIFLEKHNIEVLHVHSLIGFPKELLDEAKSLKIKTVFTTHDYYGLCPKIDFFKYDNTICNDYENGKECVLCNYINQNVKKNIRKRNLKIILSKYIKHYNFIKATYHFLKGKNNINKNGNLNSTEILDFKNMKIDKNIANEFVKFRYYYKNIIEKFDAIIFNSTITKNEYSKYVDLSNLKFKILPVTHSEIKDNRFTLNYTSIKNNKVNLLFMGYLNKKKGFWDLVNVLENLKEQYTNWQLNIYGNYSNIDINKFDQRFFKFYGKYKYNDLPKIFSNSSVLIIPSKLRETFGFIGLEAYSYGIPAIVSKNVGFSDLIKNGINGIVYEEDNNNIYLKESIIKVLKNPQLLEKFNKEILKDNFDYTLENHCKEILDFYKNI